ncbi:MAG: AmmeMemoRadiSam system protein B [Spirochaetales bacterium]|nr:AmmeMemoRadiSam system protein B [Spirochaetales bacterium]
MSIRPPAVAGQFYPAGKEALIREIESQLEKEKSHIDLSLAKKKIYGGVSPHAGYIFSLPQALHLFQILMNAEQVWPQTVLLNPNHTGLGAPLSIDSHQRWTTPLGETDVDEELAEYLIKETMDSGHAIRRGSLAHRREHSGEVILPLIQYFLPQGIFLPLCMGDCSPGAVDQLSHSLARYAREEEAPLIIASSDFTHFKSPSEGRELDDYALDAILNLDTKEFLRRVGEKGLSICGFGPIAVLLEYAKKVSTRPKVSLLKRGHSGESAYFQGQEQSEVVDYVSLLVHEE